MTGPLPPASRTGVRIAGDHYQWLVAWCGCVIALRDELTETNNPVVRVGVEVEDVGNLDDVVLYRLEPPHRYIQVKYAVDSSTPVNTEFLIAPAANGGTSILRKIVSSWRRLTESGDRVECVLMSNRAPDPADPLIAGRDARTRLLLPKAKLGTSASERGRTRARWAESAGVSEDELIELLAVLEFDIARDLAQLEETVSHAMTAAGLRGDLSAVKAGADWVAEQVRNGQRVLDLAAIRGAVGSLRLRARPAGAERGTARRWSSVLPDPPLAMVERRAEAAMLRQVLREAPGRPVVVAGMGGAGKSVIAAHLARAVRDGSDPELAAVYPAGVAWVTVGQERAVTAVQAELAQALGGDQPGLVGDWGSGRAWLRRLAEGRRGLLVLDDVWTLDRWEPFRVDVPGVQVLITTRNQELASELGCVQVLVDVLGRDQGRDLLASLAGVPASDLPDDADQVLTEVGCLALGVAMAGSIVRQRGARSWPGLLQRLQARRLDELAHRFPDGYAHATLRRAVEVAVEDLDAADQRRWAELAVFAGQGSVPESAMTALWQPFDSDDLAGRERIGRFLARSLVQRLSDGRYQLHDLQADVAVLRLGDDLPGVHGRLADTYAGRVAAAAGASARAGWAELADVLARTPGGGSAWRPVVSDYLLDHLAWHLHGAGRADELRRLLTDLAWLKARLDCGQLAGLIGDYGYAENDHLAQQILRALRLSASAVTRDAGLVRGQLIARLSGHPDPEVRAWVTSLAAEDAFDPWLTAMTPALTPVTSALEQTLTGHWGIVAAVAISPGGKEVVSGGYDGSVRVWDLATGTQVQALEGIGQVYSVTSLPDGAVAVGCQDGTVLVWDRKTGARRQLRGDGAGRVLKLATTPDGGLLAAAGLGGVVVWELDSDSPGQVLTHGLGRSLALTPDGRCAIVGGAGGIVTAWDLNTRNPRWERGGHTGSVKSVAVSPDGRSVVTCGSNGSPWVWDLATGARQQVLPDLMAWTVTVTPGGRVIAGGVDGSIRIWNPDGTAQQIRRPLAGAGKVLSMAVTSDGKRLVTSGEYDGSVRVWDLQADLALQAADHPAGGHEELSSLAVTPDGRVLTGSKDGYVGIWDPPTGARRWFRPGCPCSLDVLAVIPNGESVITGSSAGHVRLVDLTTGEERWAGQMRKPMVVSAVVTPDGKHAVTGSTDKTICVWDLLTGQAERTWTAHLLPLRSLAVSPDGQQLFSTGEDMTVRVWDLDTGEQQRLLTQGTSSCSLVTVSPTGKHLVTAGHGGYGLGPAVRVWDQTQGTQLLEIDGHDGAVQAITISADGSYLVTAGADQFLHIWQLGTGAKVASWRGDYAFRCCAVLPGKRLQLAVLEEHGQPYLLELRMPSALPAPRPI